ncbi:bifunctional biotin--[acetyl-CoA-carboxylase] ligase/biotin operon repressor BirA [Cellvibrio japonicus]|uniref:Bifunctional ligase/repressor BirA n=1 Tax=Cellvibrio japonicus (strain Ueda107) TaxID=498211 RepID=B3PK20_CELJU|nr:bifunctional biotin--[acetyl-CoA-carboxylase] ligase/biotin operon repressor BirA [Cellvibrio japonicus]ACE83708.1 biotin-[acetyl-CoA-carboxylase] ligase [Cellvibrio japonicus Ueda107]QEI11342.1 bifunctional biotin--[acetyl-CoA-carboxylase] ligase/biotin operon repressor BirA [Cellvibrio japonicus]QEI14916.1 bifunctional biotin--[acetyl-CoA-carboxylase] ligase/biotin operon repressor BirA [Cellvibrio japonicus]QEI18496.1 bifunctional biotin--[acetyl-CoA-carboxylase] ligase/biotin operon repr
MLDADFLDKGRLRSILNCLSDGNFHSGEELGTLLGVSRAAVWKQLQKLEQLGIHVASVKGKGYSIAGGLDLLDVDILKEDLSVIGQNDWCQLNVVPFLDSTNTFLMQLPTAHAAICLAEVQTAGRGRRGRHWHSPFAQNIYLSIGWGFEGGAAALEGLSLATGVAVVRALERLGFSGISLKWPNDVLYEQKKLAGILIEMSGDPSGSCQVVVGVGLNVNMSLSVAPEIGQPWTDLSLIAQVLGIVHPGRNILAAMLIDELVQLLKSYSNTGFVAYKPEWEARNAHKGLSVELVSPVSCVSGVVLGVNPQGALRLQTAEGEQLFYGGEISLRTAS